MSAAFAGDGGRAFSPSSSLNGAFYAEVVSRLVDAWQHSAALLGWGSDVLGYDTARSTDHGWGPRLQLFVSHADVDAVTAAVDVGLPKTFAGWPVRYGWDDTPVTHHVEVAELGDWLRRQIGVDARAGMSTRDWLLTPQQRLLGVVAGSVYADARGDLAAVRQQLAWYPRDVWLWLLACQWRRIAQEEAFVGRTAEVGDDLGSAVVAARLVRDIMRLCLLLDRRYAPYSKWLGTTFARIPGSAALSAELRAAVHASDAPVRESALVAAYTDVARRHNAARVTAPVDPQITRYHGRPYRVLGADRFAAACVEAIQDPWLRTQPLVGAIDQIADSTDVLQHPNRYRALGGIFDI